VLHGTAAYLVDTLLNVVRIIVFVYAILSWIPNLDRNNAIVKLIVSIGDSICAPVRKIIPPKNTGNIDWSPVIVIVLISLIQGVL